MKTMERVFAVVGVFCFAVAAIYAIWTSAAEPDGIEYVGVVGLGLGGMLGFMVAWYLNITHRKLPLAPEDDPHGDIDQIQGDYGFFTPHSWQPLFLALSAAILFLGLAVGVWVMAVGVLIGIPALIGWTYEHWRGPHAL